MVLPLFLLLVVGAIECGRAIAVQHTLAEAARAGARLYAVPNDLTEADARAVVDKVMADAALEGYTVDLDPPTSGAIQHLAPVTVSVSIPHDRVRWLPSSWFMSQATLTGTCIMPGDTGEVSSGDDVEPPPSPPPPDDDDDKDKDKDEVR